jgi:hypothetical protein
VNVPIEETVGASADMAQARYVRDLGLSEVDPDSTGRLLLLLSATSGSHIP